MLPEPYYADEFCTIYCGDSRELLPLIDADVMVTDPPYGIAYVGSNKSRHSLDHEWAEHQETCAAWDGDTAARDAVLEAWGDRPAVVFGSWKQPRPARTRQVVVWHKHRFGTGPANSDLPWGNAHEEAYIIGKGFVGRRQDSVVAFQPPPKCGRNHPTEKPSALMQHFIERCPPGAIIDPFMGSGSTLRAAKDLGRKCIGIEVDPKWCRVAVKRLAQENLFTEGAA